jgi:hypothetical protein
MRRLLMLSALVLCSCSGDDPAGPPASAEIIETGILLVVDVCPIEWCGSRYKVWNSDLSAYIPIIGSVLDSYSQQLVTVWGSVVPLPPVELEEPDAPHGDFAIAAEYVERLGAVRYHDFLVPEAHRYTRARYGCDVPWNKTFGWGLSGSVPELWVRLTDTFSGESPLPYLELRYDARDASFLREQNNLNGRNPCDVARLPN